MKKIDTRLSIKIMQLDKKNLFDLFDLINDFRDLYLHIEFRKEIFPNRPFFDLIDLGEFINYCKYKFGDLEKSGAKFSRRFNYNDYIRQYYLLLRQIIDLDMFKDLYLKVISREERVYDYYKSFIYYLYYSYNNKELILNNLKKINELGIGEFEFDPSKNYDGTYTLVVQTDSDTSKNNPKNCCVYGCLTDGDITWLNQTEINAYNYFSKNSNFKIDFIKGSINKDRVSMSLKNLEFNTNNLPTKDEIMSNNIIPNIDFNLIREKTWAVNFNYGASMSLMSACDLLEYSNYLLEHLNVAGKRDDYLKLLNQLVMLEPFIKTLEEVKDKHLDLLYKDGITNSSEVYSLTKEKIKTEKTREKYYGKRKTNY